MTQTKEPFDQRTCTQHEREVFMIIQKAVLEPAPRTLHFSYTKEKSGEKSERHVEPYEVIGGDKSQLAAHDIEKGALRRFVLSGISNLTVGEPFNARFPIKIAL